MSGRAWRAATGWFWCEGNRVFERVERDGIAVHTDPGLFTASGVGIAFSERGGGVSHAPYDSLDLAPHVGDAAAAVDENRRRLLGAIGIAVLRDRLTTAEQVHGTQIVEVTAANAGAGAYAGRGPGPAAGADALWTRDRGIPLLLLFADCVPVILVRPSIPAVAVVHAGWRGAAVGIVGLAARAMVALGRGDDLTAYIGAHICASCYEVGEEVHAAFGGRPTSPGVSHSGNASDTLSRAARPLDLARIVTEELARSGVTEERQWHLGICTAQNTDRFYSYRAEGLTGRHGALAVIL